MEFILWIVGIYGSFLLIGWLYNLWEKRREKIREQVANEIFNGLDIEKVLENYRAKLVHINYVRPDSIKEKLNTLKTPDWGKNPLLMKECPKCKKGRLILRHGKYGQFLGCSRYPNCDYTNNGKQPRQEYTKSINSQVMGDIQRAYSNL